LDLIESRKCLGIVDEISRNHPVRSATCPSASCASAGSPSVTQRTAAFAAISSAHAYVAPDAGHRSSRIRAVNYLDVRPVGSRREEHCLTTRYAKKSLSEVVCEMRRQFLDNRRDLLFDRRACLFDNSKIVRQLSQPTCEFRR